MADLASLTNDYRPDEGYELQLRDQNDALLLNDDGTPMTITVLGTDSDVAVKAKHQTSNRRLQSGPRAKVTSEGLEADGVNYLSKLTVGWNITLGGEKPAFTREAAAKLYANPRLAFIREQVDAAIADRGNFLKASPTA